MPPLERAHKRMIVKLLACDVEPDEIVERLKERCLIDLSAEEIARYNPEADPELSPELAELFFDTRAAYRGDQDSTEETAFVKVASTSAFDDQSALCLEKNDTAIALFKTDDGFYALNNTCTHRDGPLCEGTLDDYEVECPLHGARFDVRTGEAAAMPAPDDVASYDVRVRGDDIEVELQVAN